MDVFSYEPFMGYGFIVDGMGFTEIGDVACVVMVFCDACYFGSFQVMIVLFNPGSECLFSVTNI